MPVASIDIGQELLNVPMGDMIRSMALAIAEGQWQLDKASMVVTELMSGQRLLRDLETGALIDEAGNATGTPQVIDSRVIFGYDYVPVDEDDPSKGYTREAQRVSMMELGFTPAFYQFIDTIIEVKIAVTITGQTEELTERGERSQATDSAYRYDYSNWWWRGASSSYHQTAQVSQVNARYANRYGYSVEGSSLLRTKLVPVPPPAILEERVRQITATEAAFRESGGTVVVPQREE